MKVTSHDDFFSTAAQISLDDVAEVARLGYRAIICNRPDHEGGMEQPTGAALQAEARKYGLEFEYLPIQVGGVVEDDIRLFEAVLTRLPPPILAFCRTGNRSTALYHASSRKAREDVGR